MAKGAKGKGKISPHMREALEDSFRDPSQKNWKGGKNDRSNQSRMESEDYQAQERKTFQKKKKKKKQKQAKKFSFP